MSRHSHHNNIYSKRYFRKNQDRAARYQKRLETTSSFKTKVNASTAPINVLAPPQTTTDHEELYDDDDMSFLTGQEEMRKLCETAEYHVDDEYDTVPDEPSRKTLSDSEVQLLTDGVVLDSQFTQDIETPPNTNNDKAKPSRPSVQSTTKKSTLSDAEVEILTDGVVFDSEFSSLEHHTQRNTTNRGTPIVPIVQRTNQSNRVNLHGE